MTLSIDPRTQSFVVPSRWRPPLWEYPSTEVLDFSNLLVPTMDSTRALFLLRMLHKQRKAVLMVGAEGTAKTSTALMFFSELDPVKTAVKRYSFLFCFFLLSVKRYRSEKGTQGFLSVKRYTGVKKVPQSKKVPQFNKGTEVKNYRRRLPLSKTVVGSPQPKNKTK